MQTISSKEGQHLKPLYTLTRKGPYDNNNRTTSSMTFTQRMPVTACLSPVKLFYSPVSVQSNRGIEIIQLVANSVTSDKASLFYYLSNQNVVVHISK
jgi:hypothetical protein